MKEPINWFTLENGEHVPIFEGESKREALRNHLNKKMSRVEKNKDKYDKIKEYKKKKKSNNHVEEVEYLDLDFKSKYNKSKNGNEITMKPEIRKQYERKLGLDKNTLKDFNISADGTKYVMKPDKEEKIRKDLKKK